MSLEMLKPSEDAWQVGANAETFSRGLPLQPIDVLAQESGATNGGTPPYTYVPAVKTELLKKSKSTGVQNVIGSGVFRTSYEVAMPLAKTGFYAGVRKHVQGLIDNWYGKKQAGKLTVTLPLRQPNFCSVQVNRYYDDGSPSLSSSNTEGYLLAWNGKGLSKSEFEDSVLPGAMKGIESRIFGSAFIYPYDKRPYSGEVTKDGIHAYVPYPDFLRAFYDADHARGRYVTADVSYKAIADGIKPNSVFGKYLLFRKFNQQAVVKEDRVPINFRRITAPPPYASMRFRKFPLMQSPDFLKIPGSLDLDPEWGSNILTKPKSYLRVYNTQNGKIRLDTSIDPIVWKTRATENPRYAQWTEAGYFLETEQPRIGDQTTIFRATTRGKFVPVLSSDIKLLAWDIAINQKQNEAAIYGLIARRDSKEELGPLAKPVLLVKFIYNGSIFKRAESWSLSDLNLVVTAPAGLRALDLNFDGIDELILSSGHGTETPMEDRTILDISTSVLIPKPVLATVPPNWNLEPESFLHLHGSLSIDGSRVYTAWDSKAKGFSILVVDSKGKLALRFSSVGVLIDDFDNDGDIDILARDKTYFHENGGLILYEQID